MTKTAFAVVLAGMMLAGIPAHAEETIATPGSEQPLGWRHEHAEKIREEIRLHETRARELDPIIARDQQARHDVEADWIVLERHGREMHARANEFRAMAAEAGGEFSADLNKWAQELDTFAGHDEENGHIQREIAERLDRVIRSETEAKAWHLDSARRLREWLERHHF